MNRSLLETAYQELVTYRDQMTAVIDTMGAFLKLDPSNLPALAPAPAAPAPPAPAAAAPVRTKGPTTPARKQKRAQAAPSSDTAVSTGQRLLEALAATSPQRPGDLVEALRISAHIFKRVSATLEEQGHITFSGKTINRRIAITERGLKASRTQPAAAPAAASAPPADADVVAARDKAVKERLKSGPATFDQLLASLPGQFPSTDAKAAALKASLRRLTLRSEVLDAGNQFKLRAA